jgi:hypothetical protein
MCHVSYRKTQTYQRHRNIFKTSQDYNMIRVSLILVAKLTQNSLTSQIANQHTKSHSELRAPFYIFRCLGALYLSAWFHSLV